MNSKRILLPALVLALGSVIVGCSSNNSNNGYPTGPASGGGAKEFASGDIQPGHSYTHVFMNAKVIPYYCRYHGGPGGVGMSGVLTVVAGGYPTGHSFSITAMTLPTLTINVGDTMTWINNSGLTHTVQSDN